MLTLFSQALNPSCKKKNRPVNHTEKFRTSYTWCKPVTVVACSGLFSCDPQSHHTTSALCERHTLYKPSSQHLSRINRPVVILSARIKFHQHHRAACTSRGRTEKNALPDSIRTVTGIPLTSLLPHQSCHHPSCLLLVGGNKRERTKHVFWVVYTWRLIY